MTYWAPIAIVGLAVVAAGWLARAYPGWRWSAVGLALAGLLAFCEATWWLDLLGTRPFDPALDLPLQLCDLTAWAAAGAMVLRRPTLYHLTWLWGMGGAVPALFLPVLGGSFPGWFYFEFYLTHGSLIVCAVLTVFAFGVRMSREDLIRALAISGAIALCLGIVDMVTGGNYLYLRTIPPVAGSLQALSSWPLYRVALCSVAALVMTALAWLIRDRPPESAAVPAPDRTG